MEQNSEEYKAELQRRLEVLKDHLEKGKIKFAPHLFDETQKSLMAVKYGVDGKIDLSTVDARVRSLALAVTAMKDREDMKNAITLKEIQTDYFKWLENNFGEYYQKMVERNLTPHDAGKAISLNQESVDYTVSIIPKFMEVITEFWNNLIDPSYAHLEDMHILKAVFGGDLFPSAYENIASKCGLYIDTIILPDPFLRSKALWNRWSKQKQTYYFIKHALNILQYKELALADIDPPIIAILPEQMIINDDEQERVKYFAERDAIVHSMRLFGQTFSQFDEVMAFVEPYDSPEKIMSIISDPSRILFDTEWTGTIEKQIHRAINEYQGEILGTTHAGKVIAMQGFGRMFQANDLLLKSLRLHGTPLIDAPTSWKYFQWKLQYDAERMKSDNIKDLHIVRSLQELAEGKMRWIGKIPSAALIEMRKTDAIQDIRHIISSGVREISELKPEDFQASSDKIVNNIQAAFNKHQDQLKELSKKKWKFAGSDIGSWFVVGSLAVTAAATGQPIWGLAAIAADQLLDAPKLRDIPESIKKLAKESQSIKQSPVGMLFNYAHKKT
ncbi:MAG: hypothetical protein WBL58_00390 [Peptococcia bacterium]